MPNHVTASTRAGLGALVVAALVVAACGGSSTPAPSAAASAAASAAPSAAASAATGPGDVAAALDNLTSYKFKVGWTADNVSGGSLTALGSSVTISGTAVLKPTKASDVTMGLGAMNLRVVQVGDKSWVDIGTGSLIPSTDSSQSNMADAFAPDKLASSFAGSAMTGMKSVGEESKNGVTAVHYQADPTVLAQASSSLSSAFGVDGTWTIDLWMAKDGGWLTSMVMAAKGKSDGKDATFSMSIDITDVNSPSNVIATPS